MNDRDLQLVLARTGDYTGGIDGILGAKSMAAIVAIEKRHAKIYSFDPKSTTQKRREVAALQAGLHQLGFDPGKVDGWEGVNTTEALNAFHFKTTHGRDEVIERKPEPKSIGSGSIPLQKDVGRVYGDPGSQIEGRLKSFKLPFSLRLDWNLRQKVRTLRVHRDCADQLERAMHKIHEHYGLERMQSLGIDRYAGGYNKRKMRGGSKWSMHAYGCAVDFYAAPNGLRTRCPQALFCRPEYEAFLDIMEENEWLPALRLWGADAMHFQRARLK